jgi:hypothetical protein
MRASKIGRWVGRAAVVAALGFGASVAVGGVAQAAPTSDMFAKVYSVAGHRAPAAESVVITFGWDWL